MSRSDAARVLTVWCPDWPVVAASAAQDLPADAPVAVIAAGRVYACSATARQEGVRRGLRRREAQARCPQLLVLDHDPSRDARLFEPIAAAVEALAPGVAVHRPGTCAVAARGPSRYFGGEPHAAERLVDHVADHCGVECQVGIADGIFTSMHAARAGVVVDRGRSADFLASLDVAALDRPDLVDILRRLGIRTLGGFAALPEADVRARFGEDAALAHRLARGLDPRPLQIRTPPPDLSVSAELDPPAERVDIAAFATRTLAEQLHERLARHGLACTRLVIEAGTAHGEELTRQWRHDGVLSTTDIADRVRWQLDGWLHSRTAVGGPAALRTQMTPHQPAPRQSPRRRKTAMSAVIGGSGGSGLPEAPHGGPTAGISRLTLVPEGLVEQAGLQLGLWGDAGQGRERAHRALSRVQGLLGPDAVLTAVPSGGRRAVHQVRLVPWGDERTVQRPAGRPWPGRLAAPSPALVYAQPLPALVYGPHAATVAVSGRHLLTAPLCRVTIGTPETTHESLLRRAGPAGRPQAEEAVDVTSWAGPWPIDERWWAPEESYRGARFQVCLSDGRALLLSLVQGRWWVEAEYD